MNLITPMSNWKLGPQICRDPSIGEVELLKTNMSADRPLLIVFRRHGMTAWTHMMMMGNGISHAHYEEWFDIMPPKLSRVEVLTECVEAFMRGEKDGGTTGSGIAEALDHYDALLKLGRVK